ncbi:hypothetical protein EVAR_20643_1 [Eumeta japonica]|uniref:Uncharacterized protein n=1 Tax=Eumeta variegata TaxID=151549 RepID=A0A4C1V9Y2_EUMVA|nr:hypothetical protein EVAR_20643_1 [Eumeta japonica]
MRVKPLVYFSRGRCSFPLEKELSEWRSNGRTWCLRTEQRSDNFQRSEKIISHYLGIKVKLSSKNLEVLKRVRQYFETDCRFLLYKAQVLPHLEYWSRLRAEASEYQLLPLDRIQHRASRNRRRPCSIRSTGPVGFAMRCCIPVHTL